MSAPLLAVAIAAALFGLSKLIVIRAARLDGLRGTAGQWAAFAVAWHGMAPEEVVGGRRSRGARALTDGRALDTSAGPSGARAVRSRRTGRREDGLSGGRRPRARARRARPG